MQNLLKFSLVLIARIVIKVYERCAIQLQIFFHLIYVRRVDEHGIRYFHILIIGVLAIKIELH